MNFIKKILIITIISSMLFSFPSRAGLGEAGKISMLAIGGLIAVAYLAENQNKIPEYYDKDPVGFKNLFNSLDSLKPNTEKSFNDLANVKKWMEEILNQKESFPIDEESLKDKTLKTPIPIKEKLNVFMSKHPKIESLADRFKHRKDKDFESHNKIETPIPEQRNIDDYISYSSTLLGKNMVRQSGIPKPPNTAAHHIVPENDKEADDARKILKKHVIDINGYENGVFLPTANNGGVDPGITHSGRHPKDYAIEINKRIDNADIIGGKQAVLNELNKIRQELTSAKNNESWNKVIK